MLMNLASPHLMDSDGAPSCTANFLICGVKDVADGVTGAVNGTADAVRTATGVADFWSDPAGNTYKMLVASAKSLTNDVLPALTHATLPDVSADWFLKAYALSFGLAIFVLVVILVTQFVETARGRMSGQELAETLTQYGPAFLIGGIFGPAVAWFIVQFFGALSDALIQTMLSTTEGTIAGKFATMIGDDDASGIVGGAVVGTILMFFMIVALLLALLVLIVQLIGLYFSGVLFPLGWVWIVDARKRKFGSKIAFLWLGILASHPLLFFMLGITFSFVGANVDVFSSSASLDKTVTLVVSMLSLLISGLSPLLLFRFAPVLPMGGASADSGPSIGSNSMQEADQRYTASDDDGDLASDQTGSSYTPEKTSSPEENDGSSASGAEEESSSALTDAAAGPAGAAGGGAAAAGAEGASAAAAEEGAVAAGAAESSTGVGAVVGVPTMVVAAAALAFDKAQSAANATADMAAGPVEDHEQQYGRDSTGG
jgi:type IV secretion system protein TrbL